MPLDIITFDFPHAFDRMPRHKLIQQLSQYGLPRKMMAWIINFLSDRSQAIKVGVSSTFKPVMSGVI